MGEDIKCPVCKSDKIEFEEFWLAGQIGEFLSGQKKLEYFVCKKCGVMFRNIQ